eukprot:TRINITY_DN10247_c0_g1_i1.p1 TRINITY_DN10247_c0_g1~~TRINITY_DN10247_c0_g1_i1.p1  ORF type:complete len:1017 (-),score=288.01 TRINITY_DN10247_c0_g1_i1:34-3084(-)
MSGFGIDAHELKHIKTADDVAEYGGVNKIIKAVNSSAKKGLSKKEEKNGFIDRIEAYGSNAIGERPYASFFELFVEAFDDVAVQILCVAAAVSLTVAFLEIGLEGASASKLIEGIAIFIAVMLVAIVTAVNDWSKDKKFRSMNKLSEEGKEIKVLRGGDEYKISCVNIVVGDIIILERGDQLPADGIFIEGHDLILDESTMTGEPVPIRKKPEDPHMMSGTMVSDGRGTYLATAVGLNSEWGATMAQMSESPEDTPLQKKLDELVLLIGKIGLAVAILVFIVLFIYWLIDSFIDPKELVSCVEEGVAQPGDLVCDGSSDEPGRNLVPIENPQFTFESASQLLKALLLSITIVVVAVPEGLPLAVTISLAYSMRSMMIDKNFVRHLDACEVMGGATTICSDKTGTLTENRMTVVQGNLGGLRFKSVDKVKKLSKKLPADFKELLTQGICVNSSASFYYSDDGDQIQFEGNPTECSLLIFSDKLGVHFKKVRKRAHILRVFNFNSSRKRMSTFVETGDGFIMYTKGAPEVVLERSTKYRNADGEVVPLTDGIRDDIMDMVTEFAKEGLRTLLLGYREFEDGEVDILAEEELVVSELSSDDNSIDIDRLGANLQDATECDITVLGVVGIADPVRPEVPRAVRICQNAGIKVRMVTGDNPLTARSIAKQCDIINEGDIVLTGPEFARMTDAEVDEILPRLSVLARSQPSDKERLVGRLKYLQEVVAVTGDGTNDARALKTADVGLSMGIAGTAVAKEASDIIILDDNFKSIVSSVMWGRSVYDNIRKFVQFQVTVNVVALSIAFIGAIAKYGTPLTAVQLLWVNLIMDTMAALALGTEKPTLDLLRRKPYGRGGRLLTFIMWRNILGQSAFQITVLCLMLFAIDPVTNRSLIFPNMVNGQLYGDEGIIFSTHFTMIFNVFVFCQVFNEINSRKCDESKNVFQGLFSNYIFIGVLVVTVAVQLIIVQFASSFVQCVPLTFEQWLISITIGFFSIPVGFIIRMIPVPVEDWEVSVGVPIEDL